MERERNNGVVGPYPNVSWHKSEVSRLTNSAEMDFYFRQGAGSFRQRGFLRRLREKSAAILRTTACTGDSDEPIASVIAITLGISCSSRCFTSAERIAPPEPSSCSDDVS